MLKILFPVILLVQCQVPESAIIEEDIVEVFFEEDTIFEGVGESGVSGYSLQWDIRCFNNDSVIMLGSYIDRNSDTLRNSQQFFGKLIKSEKYDYEIVASNYYDVYGCNKPYSGFLDYDTIPFYVDSFLLSYVDYWKVNVKGKVDTLIIKEALYLYKSNLKSNYEDIFISIIPNRESGLYPSIVKSGLRCGVYFSSRGLSDKYFLNKTQKGYELVIESFERNGMIGKQCDYCVKKIQLN